MSEIEKLNMIAEWQEQHKQLIEDLDNSKKRIAELEKDKAYTEGQLDEQIQATLKLQKENAELKEKSKRQSNNYKHDVDMLIEGNKHKNEVCKELAHQANVIQGQLTKAKEIIKDLLGSENTSCEEEMFFEIRQKAEQFLKE